MDIVNGNVLGLLSGVIGVLDEAFKGSSLRKELGLAVQARKVKRSVMLPMGELQFSRTMYFQKRIMLMSILSTALSAWKPGKE